MILLDTHTWLWLLHDPTQLSDPAQTIITEAENNNSILISSISVWELFYSVETEGFIFREFTDDKSKTRFYKFIGDAQKDVAEDAKNRLKKMLYDEDKIDEKLDMEPLKILKEISLDLNIKDTITARATLLILTATAPNIFGKIF